MRCVIAPTWDSSSSQSDRIAAASLVVDGDCGARTCTEWQSQLGCTVDGEITGQWSGNQRYTRAASCITDWSNVGESDCVMAIQRKLGIGDDGFLCTVKSQSTISASGFRQILHEQRDPSPYSDLPSISAVSMR